MVKLLSVKKIADCSSEIKYELKYKQAGVSKSMVIKENRHWVEDIQEYISTINSEDSTFYELFQRYDTACALGRLPAANAGELNTLKL